MIPEQLHDYERFIKLEVESKAPATREGQSPDHPLYRYNDQELTDWIESGGNVGLNLGPLVVFDVDSDRFRRVVRSRLPGTFTVRSGGGGEHLYYRCPWSGRKAYTDSGKELGSIRSGNWYVAVPPSIHPNTGDRYRVLESRPVQPIPTQAIQDVIDELPANTAAAAGGSGGGSGGGVGGSVSVPEIPSEYPDKHANWEMCRSWLKANGLLDRLNKTTSTDWSGLEFLLAKCLAEGGFSESSISQSLDRLHHNAKWHRRDSDYRTRTVRKAIVAAVNDEYVTFPDDSGEWADPDEGEARYKTMSNDATYKTKKEVVALESDDPIEGESTVKATATEVRDGGDQYDFVQIVAGTIEEDETFGTSPNWQADENGMDKSRTIGSADPDYLRTVADALDQLADELEDEQ